MENYRVDTLLILLVIVVVFAIATRLLKPKSGPRKSNLQGFPYVLGENFLSPAELNFFHVLRKAVGDSAVLCTKVNLGDIFAVKDSRNYLAYRSKIDRKHVDFLLCDSTNMQPILAIELDDKSHERKDRQERDAFVDLVFNAAKLPLLHIAVKRTYVAAELAAQINPYLQITQPTPAQAQRKTQILPEIKETSAPRCPKCGSVMTIRVVKNGENAGNKFWGCSTYPACRGMMRFTQS